MKPATLSALRLSIRAGLSACLALTLAVAFKVPFPLYALVAAVIVTDLSPKQTRQLGRQRLAGTMLGALLGGIYSHFLPAGPLAIGLGVFSSMFLSHLSGLVGAAKITGYICGIIMLDYQGEQWFYSFYRLIETVLGIMVALFVSYIPKLLPGDEE